MTRNAWMWVRNLRFVLAIAIAICMGTVCRGAQQDQGTGKGKLELLHVQGNVYMLSGAGANIAVQVGSKYVIVVDTGITAMKDEVLAAIQSFTAKHIIFIVNTSGDNDHTGANGTLSAVGLSLPNESIGVEEAIKPKKSHAQNTARENALIEKEGGNWLDLPTGASIVAHANVLNWMSDPSGKETPIPSEDWPTDPYDNDHWTLYNDEGVFLYHPPNAHTDGDTFVLFRGSDVVSTGDIFTLASYPVIDEKRGGNINGLIDALNQIISMLDAKAMASGDEEEGGTYVIPGHGRLCDRNDVVIYRDMVTIIRGRIQYYIDQGKTLEQVLAANPTIDYDVTYGNTTGPWTTKMFVEAIYRDLTKTKNQPASKVGGGS